MLPQHHFQEIVHKALASDTRRAILLSLGKGDKYLSELANELGKQPQTIDFHLRLLEEIGLVDSELREGKKFYILRDRRILDFLREGRPLPPHLHPKPPHEEILERLDAIEAKIDAIRARLAKIEKN